MRGVALLGARTARKVSSLALSSLAWDRIVLVSVGGGDYKVVCGCI